MSSIHPDKCGIDLDGQHACGDKERQSSETRANMAIQRRARLRKLDRAGRGL